MTATATRVITVGSAVAAMMALGVVAWRIICYHNDDVAEIRQAAAITATQTAADRAAIREKTLEAVDKASSVATTNSGEIKAIAVKIESVQSLLVRIDTDRREQNAAVMQALQRLERNHGRTR